MKKSLIVLLLLTGLIFSSFNAFAALSAGYTGSPFTFYNGNAITNITPTPSGGSAPYTFSAASLPAGLSINAGTGVISGTPTVIMALTNYVVKLTDNVGATVNTTLSVTIDGIVYTTTPYTFYQGITGTLNAAARVGAPTSCSTSPSLPPGLSINSNGTISGKATAGSPVTVYTVSAVYGGVTTTSTVSLSVDAINYAGTPFVYTTGASVSTGAPTITGDVPTSYSIGAQTLPAGLSFDGTIGIISGNPTAAMGATNYTITAYYGGGTIISSTTVVNITVSASSITYATGNIFYNGTTITPLSPGITGTTPSGYSVSSLPAGLSINTTTGVISGTPTTNTANANYTITAYYLPSSVTTTKVISIAIDGTAYLGAPNTNYLGTTITAINATTIGTPTSFSASGLPAGLTINTSNGQITGAANSTNSATTYTVTVTVNYATGSSTATVNIPLTAPTISYASSTYTLYKGVAITPNQTIVKTGTPTSYAVSPILPAGLTVSTTTGTFFGTPTVAAVSNTYTVTATYQGLVTAQTTLTVNVDGFSYAGTPYTCYQGTAITPITPTTAGGDVPASYSVTTPLPTGLSLDPTTGIISGTPTGTAGTYNFTIKGTYAGGTSTAAVRIVVSAPTLTYNTNNTFVTGTAITPLTPTVKGSPTGYSISNSSGLSLPAGLSIDPTTGIISGTPTSTLGNTVYTVTATFANGFTATKNIAIVVEGASYPATLFTYYQGTAIATLTPTRTGTPTSYGLTSTSPALPTGLTLNSTSGTLTGTPSVASASQTYTVLVTFSGGLTTTATINFQVLAPTVSYSAPSYTFYKGVAITSLTATKTGTPTGYSITSTPSTLPAGLAISAASGTISGTPTAPTATTAYTIKAQYAGTVSATTSMNITVDGLSYTGSPYTYRTGTAITPLTPATIGTATSYSITPVSPATSLPPGLSFDTTTGIISGTPTATQAASNYTITANFAGGSSSTKITITVSAASINYTGSPFTYYSGTAIATLTPTVTGTPITPNGFSISAPLPAGLSFNTTTGVISGTPTTKTAGQNYTITATYAGSITATKTIYIVVDGFTYAGSPFSYYQGVAIATAGPTRIGTPASYFTAALPAGLTLNTTTGNITGTPTTVGTGTYTIKETFATGSSVSTTVSMTVSAPNAVYPSSSVIYYTGAASTNFTPTITGSLNSFAVTSSPALTLTGLNIRANTGIIYGVPTTATANTPYTITATNAGGAGPATAPVINITVLASTISYTGSPYVYYKGTAITNLTPTIVGTTPTSYSVNPALPAGLSIGNTTGIISGTPTGTNVATNYTVKAAYSGGVTSTYVVNITVSAPTLSYAASPFTCYTGTAIPTLPPTVTGNPIGGYSVSPSLPAGLTLNPINGQITGTPTTPTALGLYTVTATYMGGVTATANVSITVNGISYTGSPFAYTKGTLITSVSPATIVGTPTAYSISPNLTTNTGLSFSTTTGIISGTPTINSSQTTYTISATFSGGTGKTTIIIAVGAPVVTYAGTPFSFYKGATVSLTPASNGGTPPYTYAISSSPALPAGLTFNTGTGVISGSPTTVASAQSYTVTITDAASLSSNTPISIAVANTSISYAGSPFSYFTGAAIATLTPTVAGTPTSYGISPSLPPGLSIDPVTGNISGTPTAGAATQSYTVTANYPASATATTTISITVTASSITYSGSPFTYYTGTTISSLTPVITGSPTAISASLPAGLSIDPSTGIISGTPTSASVATNYTITATYSGGVTATATINIGVLAPTISYTGSPFTYYNGSAITSLTPTVTGSPTGFSASLPSGLSIDPTTGIISGTPNANSTAADYTITANYNGGVTATTTVNITVISPTLSYTGSPFSFYAGSAISTITPTFTGTPASITINQSLPAGLTLDFTTGIITGTPTAASTASNYIITLNYAGGVTATATISITVTAPTINYAGAPFSFYTGADIGTNTPVVTGAATAFGISATLPAGLSFDTGTGIITGTPTGSPSTGSFTVTATYSGGVIATASINVTVANPSITYTGSPYNYFTGTPIATLTPATTGSPTTIVINPNLPTGLSFDPSTGIISGTPTAASAAASYIITTTNNGGVNASATINITVNASSISYTGSPFTYYTGATITSLTPAVTGTATGYTISPTLPSGLAFDPTTAIISGTPSAASPATDYLVTANYASGVTATTTVNFTVLVPSISYSGSPLTLYQGSPISSLTPIISGNATGFSVNPALPSGLAFDPITGIISGTPSVLSAAADYIVTATFTGGVTATADVNITITAPGFVYAGAPYTYYNGTAIAPVSPTNMGSPTGYSIGSTLPSGLSFSTTTGTISGTPSTTSPSTNYIVTANYAGGVIATYTVNITVSGPLFTWTGAGSDSNWDDASNWSGVGGGYPIASDNVTIPTTANPPTLDVPSSVASLIISSSTTINLATPLTVTGGLFLTGGNLAFTGTSTATFGGASTIGSTNNLTIGASNTVTFNSTMLTLATGSTSGTTEAITNNGTLNLNSTTLNEGNYLTINNTADFNLDNSTVALSNAVTDFTTYSANLTTGSAAYSLMNSGTITANDNSVFTLNTVGTIYNAGTFVAGTSNSACTLNLSGNGSAIVNAGTFTEGSTSITNLTGGTYNDGFGTINSMVTNTSGNIFALLSDSYGSATIGQITNGGVFTGNYYVQHYLQAASNGGYRLVSSPVFGGTSASPAANYADFTYLNATTPLINGTSYPGAAIGGPGGSANGFTLANSNPSAYLYDEAIIVPAGTPGTFFNGKNVGLTQITPAYVQYKNTNLSPAVGTTPVYAGTGLNYYDIGPSTAYATHGAINATTISFNGGINQSNIPFYNCFAPTGNLSYTTGTGATYVGYNLVGNPYASTIDLNQVAVDNFTSGTVTFYELTDAQTYCSWTYNVGTGVGTSDGTSVQYIASGQGFFILATGTGQSLTFKEDQKVNATVPASFLAVQNGRKINLASASASINGSTAKLQVNGNQHTGLHLMLAKDNLTFKTCGIFFNDAWSDKLDANDAKDLDGISPKIYLSSYTADGTRTSINAMANYTQGKNVKLYVKSTTDGVFNMSLTDIANVDTTTYNVYLIDHYKNDTLNIGHNKTYSFNIANADTTTFGGNRFVLAIQPKLSAPYRLLSFNGIKNTANVALKWKTDNEGTFTSFGIQKYNAQTKDFKTIDSLQSNGGGAYTYLDGNPVKGTNTYRLVQNGTDGTITYSDALVINYGIGGLLSVYPNPAVDVITVNLTSIATSVTENYDITVFNSMGAVVMQKSVSGDAASQDVSSLKPGVYFVDVKSKYGNSIGTAKFIKN